MEKKCSLRGYLFKLKHIIVAPKLLGIFHLLTQIGMVCGAVVAVVDFFHTSLWQGLLSLVLAIIGIPLLSVLIRFYFELLTTPFAISKNLEKIRKGLFDFDCECDGCCGEHGEEVFDLDEIVLDPTPVKPAPKKAVAKAPAKKPAPKRTVIKKK
jgi:hypothetical protein